MISDGGCCIILTTEERARDLAHRPVYVRGAAGGTTHHSIQAMADMTRTAAAVSGPKAFAEAGITPADVDMFAMYDSFTYTVLVVLEDLGFAPKGEGGAVRDRRRRQPAARRRAADQHRRRRAVGDASRGCAGCSCCARRRASCAAKRATRRCRAPRSRSRTAAAAGCRRRRRSCSEPEADVMSDFIAHNGVDWAESPKYLWPRADTGGPRVLGGRPARRAAHPALHDLRQAPALPAHAVHPLREGRRSNGSPRAGSRPIYSFTVIRQNGVPPFNERVPFVVAVLDLDEAGRADDRGDAEARAGATPGSACGRAPSSGPATDEVAFVDFAPVD